MATRKVEALKNGETEVNVNNNSKVRQQKT